MFEILLGTVFAFFSIVGIAEICRSIKEHFLTTSGENIAFVISLRGHNDRIEYLVRSLVFRGGELRTRRAPAVLLVDDGMDEETRRICDILARELNCVHICKSGEVPVLIAREV
jgi:hypothetical protein